MSEAMLKSNTSNCVVAALAREASEIIGSFSDCDLAAIDRLLKVERLASGDLAQSREGALFQIAVVNAHADTILSYIPENSPDLPRLEAIYEEVQRLLYSVSALLKGQGQDRVQKYYFHVNPFHSQH